MYYRIPKNRVVILNANTLGRDPLTWEDPLSFKPECFLNKNLDLKGTNYELLSFALKQIQLILASLMHAFDWSLPPSTLRKKKPLLLIPKKMNDLVVE
ncbi:hypothetical protein M9H77_18927 [Catharanthus roseus]|uniref:Uncharacterized protein n=1 Tax=Catharanthus roseus TaxID=4058 RepID=A0ACC0B8W6_CATRO|nr:hypothetical protein M9H77_18927 [Catharanthus roseus]